MAVVPRHDAEAELHTSPARLHLDVSVAGLLAGGVDPQPPTVLRRPGAPLDALDAVHQQARPRLHQRMPHIMTLNKVRTPLSMCDSC